MFSVASPFLSCTSSIIDPEDQPLVSFDDVLDIAREVEFASAFTYCAEIEEPNPFSLEYLFATMFNTEKTEEGPIPTSIPRLTLDTDRDFVRACEAQLLTYPSLDLTKASPVLEIPQDPVPLRQDDDVRIKVEDPVAGRLLGWSPPDGSLFLELDDDPSRPKILEDKPHPPWLAKILTPTSNAQQAQPRPTWPTMRPANDDQCPQKPAAAMQAPSTTRPEKHIVDPRSKPQLPQDRILSPRHAPPSVKAQSQSRLDENSNATKPFVAPKGKPPKLRLHHPATVPLKHASAPRGGIPPHIARSVTKANVIRAKQERKMTTASKGSAGQGRKPSVLGTTGEEREQSKVTNGASGRKKVFTWDDEEWDGGRVTKKTRV